MRRVNCPVCRLVVVEKVPRGVDKRTLTLACMLLNQLRSADGPSSDPVPRRETPQPRNLAQISFTKMKLIPSPPATPSIQTTNAHPLPTVHPAPKPPFATIPCIIGPDETHIFQPGPPPPPKLNYICVHAPETCPQTHPRNLHARPSHIPHSRTNPGFTSH